MENVISVGKEPGIEEEKRAERIQAAVRLHKAKRTPRHHRTHFEIRRRAKERAWEKAKAEQERRRISTEDPTRPEEEQPEQPRRKQLRSVVIID
jgi:hypothetical protein